MKFAACAAPLPATVEHVFTMETQGEADALAAANGMIAVATAEEFVRPRLWWIDGAGSVAARPSPPPPPALNAGVEADWAGLPPGATVRVVDPSLDPPAEVGADTASGAGLLAIRIDAAGPWRLVVDEAFPTLAAVFDIEVGE
ncbi:MAG: hypothetical protein ACE37J_13810 [Pikeienuella sp.]|uniref:hypothetical protein n=1 Tax=Pikeienuella sp. TaxID=2831957 RepID=UPI00391AE47E